MRLCLHILGLCIKAVIAVPLFTLFVAFVARNTGIEVLQRFDHASSDPLVRWICTILGGFGVAALWLSILASSFLVRFRRPIASGLWSHTISCALVFCVLIYLRVTDGHIAWEGIAIVFAWIALGLWELSRWRTTTVPNQPPQRNAGSRPFSGSFSRV